MTESLLLYMNLRSKQIVRLFAGIGPFRCLFLIGIAAILFYAFTKVTSVWILPVCYLLMLWLYHNSRKDKEFLSLQVQGIKRLFTAEYLLLGLPFIISGIIAANYISLPVIILIAVVMPWIHPVRFHSIVLPIPLLYRGICCIEGCSGNKYHCMRYCSFCLSWEYCMTISISVKYA